MAGPLIVGLISEKPVRGAAGHGGAGQRGAGQGRGRSRGAAGQGAGPVTAGPGWSGWLIGRGPIGGAGRGMAIRGGRATLKRAQEDVLLFSLAPAPAHSQ